MKIIIFNKQTNICTTNAQMYRNKYTTTNKNIQHRKEFTTNNIHKRMNLNKHTNIQKTSNNYINQTSKYTTKKDIKKQFYKQQF